MVLDASRPSDCIDLLRRLSHAHRETCHVRASFDLHAKRPQVLVCSHRVGKHARVGRSRPVRGPSHCPTHRRCVSGVRAVPQHCVPDVRRQPGWASPVHMLWEGLVEIKCRYTLRESGDFGQLAWMCLVDDKYCLSRNHRHFFQVQMQLFAANKSYCDFVVWSPEGLFVERIYPDREWWVTWSGQGVMPELCAQYFSKKAILATTTSTSQNVIVAASESVASGNYCVCQGGDDGTTMICCDDENCSVQWFHTRCMKLKRVPKGKWFCPQCKPTKRK